MIKQQIPIGRIIPSSTSFLIESSHFFSGSPSVLSEKQQTGLIVQIPEQLQLSSIFPNKSRYSTISSVLSKSTTYSPQFSCKKSLHSYTLVTVNGVSIGEVIYVLSPPVTTCDTWHGHLVGVAMQQKVSAEEYKFSTAFWKSLSELLLLHCSVKSLLVCSEIIIMAIPSATKKIVEKIMRVANNQWQKHSLLMAVPIPQHMMNKSSTPRMMHAYNMKSCNGNPTIIPMISNIGTSLAIIPIAIDPAAAS